MGVAAACQPRGRCPDFPLDLLLPHRLQDFDDAAVARSDADALEDLQTDKPQTSTLTRIASRVCMALCAPHIESWPVEYLIPDGICYLGWGTGSLSSHGASLYFPRPIRRSTS